MSKTAIGVEFEVNDLNARYEVVGNSENYSFQYDLGKGSSLVANEGDITFRQVPLQGNYGIFDIRVFAVSDIGVRSQFIQGEIEVFPNFVDSTFTFSDINVGNLPSDATIGKEVTKKPLFQGDSLNINSEYIGRSVELSWSLIAPYGHKNEGEVLSSELLGDTFFNKFSLSFKTGENLIPIDNSTLSSSVALQDILSSQDVTGALNNYRDFSINLNENLFNELNIDRTLSVEIVAYDKFDRTATGIITGVNYPPIVNNFTYNLLGGEFNASYFSRDTDFLNLNCQGFLVQQDYDLYSDTSISDNIEYYELLDSAPVYSDISGITYDVGDMVLYTDGKIYESNTSHQNDPPTTSPTYSQYWDEIGVKPRFSQFGKAGNKEFFTNQQRFGFDYYYSFAAVDEYGIGDYLNLTESGLHKDGVLKKVSVPLKIEKLSFYEREDDLIFNWDIIDGLGNSVDLNQYKFLFKNGMVPGIVGISGSLFDPHTNEFLTGITEGSETLSADSDDFGNKFLVESVHNAKVFNTFEYTRELNNQIHGTDYLRESGKRSVGLEVGIINNLGDVIQKERIIGDNPPPVILREGFAADSEDQVTKVKFNFNYANGRNEKTSEVLLYRSSDPQFEITGADGGLIKDSEPFVKSVLGAADITFGENICQIIDDNPEVGEKITGYYYKILPFDDFGSGQIFECLDNQGALDQVWVFPKNYYSKEPNVYPGPALNITTDEIPGPVIRFEGDTSFENYFLNWSAPESEITNNGLIQNTPKDIDYYEVWQSTGNNDKFIKFYNNQFLNDYENATGYRRIRGVQYTTGDIPQEFNDFAEEIENAVNIFNIDASAQKIQASQTGLVNDRRYFWVRPVDSAGNKGPFTGAYNSTSSYVEGLELTLGQVKTTDISDFEQDITNTFPKGLALVPNDPFADDISNQSISWDRHFVYYKGTGYVIGPGETQDPFVYWSATGKNPTHDKNIVRLTSAQSGELGLVGAGGGNDELTSEISNPLRNIVYSGGYDTSSYHPAGEGTSIGVDEARPSLLGDEHDFIIARNAGGIATPMWHAFANALIGSAHIQDAAITNAKIHNLTADKIRSAEIYGQDIQVGGNNLSGQIRSAGFSGLHSTDINGDLAQGFAISGNGKFVFQTKNGKIYFEDDELTVEGNIRQKDGSNFTLLNVSASPNYFDYIETEANDIVPEYDSDYVKISAYYKNINIDPTEVRFKALGTDGYVYFDYDDNVNGLYDISGFKYNPALTASSAEFNISGGFDLGSNRATAVLDVSGFDAMIRNLNPAMNGSVVVFASGIDVGVEAATSIGILSDGAPGPTGRSPIYRGVWSDQKDYIGVLEGTNGFDNLRGDLVFLSGDYYISTNNSGPGLVGIGAKNPGLPEGENFWKTFGAQFESVATKLLLAEDAVITHSLIMGEEDPDNPGAGIGGVIKTVGKEYANGITGFFLANTGSALSGPNPQFDIGSDSSYIRFDGLSDKIELKGTFINNSVQDPTVVFDSNNASDNLASFIGGGYNNNINFETGFASAVVGGGYNSITGRFSFIGGGFNNVVNDNFSAIVGGYNNLMPLLDSGNEGANFIGAGVQNTISGGTTQSIVNGFDNLISDQSSSFLYDPDNSIFSDKFLGKGIDETILTTDGYADNTRFPTDGSIDYWENGFFFSYHENDQIYSAKGLDSENWFYSIDFGWFWIDELNEYIYDFSQQDRFPNWIYISGDSTSSPVKTGLGWTYFQSTHTQTGIDNTPNGVTSGEGIVFYQPSKILNPTGIPGWVYMCKDNAGTIYYSGANSNINWQPLNT